MFEAACPQCKKIPEGAASRLVRDACGHKKCRKCLLVDEENCQQCQTEDNKDTVKKENQKHSGVITRNGSVKKVDIGPDVKNGRKTKEKKRNYKNVTIPDHVVVLKDPTLYKCNICKKQFATKSHIKYHVYCAGQTKPFTCGQCAKTFITKAHLHVHLLGHSGTRPFACNICEKSFSERNKLKRHKLLHSATKPYVCAECGKAFRGKESLKIHTLIHRGEKPFSCRVCNHNFNNTSNLNKHLITHSNEKSHMCDQCGKSFKLKCALTVHRRSHLRLRPFGCGTCDKAFVNEKDLQRHQLIHLDAKAYMCSICTTSFRRKDNLHRHARNTHPGLKIEPITATVKQLLAKPPKPIDNPNAINVITASPACKSLKTDNLGSKSTSRTGTVINGPLKLAFKTSTFKSNYNIHRDYYECEVPPKSYDLAESVNICQKILSPSSPPPRNIIRKVSEPTSTEICQKILSPFPSKPLHYETSFEHKTHARIKNIKFKLPPNYPDFNTNDKLNEMIPLQKETTNVDLRGAAATSVIVNSNLDQGSMHWRRRTSQNLSSKVLDN